ncbi:integrase [Fusobacterium sp.]|uniref:tyrosine-type recombinase/integrase n=1 Tax=Fusobacterium sp. TaxID=68766 RepID=UPI002618B117|nr:integrase [Fusobacterium sp.]
MKNANGTGSIIKLSGKRRRPYALKITTGYTIEGKQLRKIIGYFETRKDALNGLLEYNQNKNIFITDITFKNIYEVWSKEHFEKIAEQTKKSIKYIYRTNMHKLNDYKIKDIKLIDLQNFINDLKEKGLSTGTLKQVKSILNMMFNYALKNEYINKNMVEFLDIGKYKKVIERKVFTNEEINILWNNKGERDIDIILILIYTGLRINELLSLENNQINIEERYIKAGSKTDAGKDRLIPINYKIFPLITKYIKLNNKYLFQSNTGNHLIYNNYRPIFKKIMQDLQLQEHTIHDTRHTFATLLSNANANKTSIKNIIGHTSYGITEKFYTHKDILELKKAVDLL